MSDFPCWASRAADDYANDDTEDLAEFARENGMTIEEAEAEIMENEAEFRISQAEAMAQDAEVFYP